jgi:arylsulfatase
MGTIGITIAGSTPQPTELPRPDPGAPNVLVIVLDDVGFAQLGPFGSGIETPAISGLANGGLRYRNHHVTAMCSPTRAAMLTGQNHHAVGMGFLPEVPIGFPGYTGRIPPTAAAMPRLLRDAGYSTFAVGKWHLTPRWEVSASGPFARWPLGLGFERYYGFLAGDTNQFAPELVCDNGVVEPPATPAEGYHVTEDLTDRAIRFVQDAQQATPGKPFLLWFATGAQHAPHQAPAEFIERFRGRFDQGWDAWRAEVLARQIELGVVPVGTEPSERPPWVEAWDDLDADRRRLFARMMEVYAGFLAHTDAQIARLLDSLRDRGLLDNTLVMLVSDNGASAEGGPHGSFNEHRFTHDRLDDPADALARLDELGGPRSYNHYAWGWAWAGNTPFKLWKRYTWLGGVRTPLIVHWPARIGADHAGSVRTQFCHAVDILPTVLAATGVDRPASVDGVAQRPLDGASLVDTFTDADAPSPRDRQYFELLGSRAIYADGWKATTDHVGGQLTIERELLVGSRSFDDDRWHLYRLADDFAEVHDLADAEPERVAEMEVAWWDEARRNQVLPLDDTFTGRAVALEPNPWPPGFSVTYRPGGGPVAEDMLVPMGAGFTVLADVTVPEGGGAGIVAALGDWNSGWAVWLADGRASAAVNLFGDPHRLVAATALGAGRHEIALEYRRVADGGGPLRLFADEVLVAETALDIDLPFRWQIGGAGLRIGHDAGLPVTDDYEPPFAFDGEVHGVEIQSHALAPPNQDDAHLHRLLRHE